MFSIRQENLFFHFLLFLIALNLPFFAVAQTKVIVGNVRNQHSGEPVPYASVRLFPSGLGKMADSSGSFQFQISYWPKDTIEITSIGYEDLRLVIVPPINSDTLWLNLGMAPGKYNVGVVIRKKANRGVQMWKRIVARKAKNDRYRFANFSYELYNKLELDIKNVNKEKLTQNKLLRPFHFIFDNIDTADGASYLPAYLTEAISHYYYQKSPQKRREVFKAVKTMGVENESVARLLGGMDQVVNFYNNFIPVFDKQFISPISDNGDAYYNYKVADTQYYGGKRLIHFFFTPKRKGENTFEGDCWVHDTTYAIQKMNLRLDKEANINYVDRLELIQEYQLINDSTWFLAKDKFVIDISPLSKTKLSFIGRKTTTYRNVVVNDVSVLNELAKNKQIEETILPEGATAKSNEYWSASRHDQLSQTEQSIYKMIDTLLKVPAFVKYTRIINFVSTGYLDIGNYQIGPWQNWVSSNLVEGVRLRFDLGTNQFFSKKYQLHGYLAYGFGDNKWKGEIDGMYMIRKNPRNYIYGSYVNDFDYGQTYFDEISSDNIFALAIRKQNVPIKFIRQVEMRLDGFKEWASGFSVLTSLRHKQYNPVLNLPEKENFINKKGDPMTAFETSVRLRYAYLEKFLENTFSRISLGSQYPIVEFKISKGFSGVYNSSYAYHKISAGVSNFRKIPPFGHIYFNVFGGKTIGVLPYPFLDVAPGNEMYYYNRSAYNLINRYEFLHDRYAGINLEHTIGNGLFRFIPITRKLKIRQLWTVKTLWGGLSPSNRQLNFTNGYPFASLDGKMYMEVGTGIDNILKVLRVDFIWKPFTPVPAVSNVDRFGIFGSFRFSF